MAQIDRLGVFFSDQAYGAQGTVTSHIIDLNSASKKVGIGTPIAVTIRARDACVAAGGAATVRFYLKTSTDGTTFSVTLFDSGALAKTTLVAGYNIYRGMLPKETQRYIRVEFTVATADTEEGSVDAYLHVGESER